MQNETLEKIRQELLIAEASTTHSDGASAMDVVMGPSALLFVGEYGHFIYNLKLEEITFFSQNARALLRIKDNAFTIRELNSLIHPDDVEYFIENEKSTLEFFDRLTRNQRFKFKAAHDFRIRRYDGSYIRVYKQSMVFELDNTGKPELMLIMFTDISHLKSITINSITYTGLNGEEVPASPVGTITHPNSPFTKRELDVLRMVALNKKSSEIACALFISPHTVKIHRKKLLKKAGVDSSLKLVLLSKEKGWL